MSFLVIRTLLRRPLFWLTLLGDCIFLIMPGHGRVWEKDGLAYAITASQVYAFKMAILPAFVLGWLASQLANAHASLTAHPTIPNLRRRVSQRLITLGCIAIIVPTLLYSFNGGRLQWYTLLSLNFALYFYQLAIAPAPCSGWLSWLRVLENTTIGLFFAVPFIFLIIPTHVLPLLREHAPLVVTTATTLGALKLRSFLNPANWGHRALNPGAAIAYIAPEALPDHLQPKPIPKLRSLKLSKTQRSPSAFTVARAIKIENPTKIPWLALPILIILMHIFFYVNASRGLVPSTPQKPLASATLFWFAACVSIIVTPFAPRQLTRLVSRQILADGVFLFSTRLSIWLSMASLLIFLLPNYLSWPPVPANFSPIETAAHALSALAGLPFIFILSIWHNERTLGLEYLIHLIAAIAAGIMFMANICGYFFSSNRLLFINLLLAVATHALFWLWLRRHYARADLITPSTA